MRFAFVAGEVSKGAQAKAAEAPVREIVKVFSYLDPQYAPAEDIGEDILAYQQYLHATDPAIPLNGILNRAVVSTLQRDVASEIETRRQDKKELETQIPVRQKGDAAPAASAQPSELPRKESPADWW